jgi:molybdopterin-guanine dinucleotide biosynthesis protein A
MRMGEPKEWLHFGDEYLLQRTVRIVAGTVGPVVVAGRHNQPLPPLPKDVRVVHDTIANCGPLAGMDAGFTALADECAAAFVTSCDHPFLSAAVITRLIGWLNDHPAVVVSHEDRLYPLTAVYRVTVRELLRQRLGDRMLRVHEFARSCGAHIVPADMLRDIDPDLDSLRNVNDPAMLQEMQRKAERQTPLSDS